MAYTPRPDGAWVNNVSKITAAEAQRWETNQQDASDRVDAEVVRAQAVEALKAGFFTQTLTKTGPYTASGYEIVPLDTSGGTIALTGPSSGQPFGARWKAGSAGPTIVAPAGFTIAGAASIVLSLPPSGAAAELVIWAAFSGDYQPIAGFKGQSQLNAANDVRYDASGAAAAAQAAAATDATTKAAAAQTAAATDATSKVAAETTRAQTAEAARAPLLTRVVTKTAAYTAGAGELVPTDTSAGAFAVTGPTWANGRQWGVRWDAGTAAPIPTGAARVDTGCGTTTGSSTVTDPSILASDQGRLVTGAGIPAGSYVGPGTITPGVSYQLSSSSTTQTAVTATATAASVSLTISDVIGPAASPTASMTLPPTGGAGETIILQGTTSGRWEILEGQKPQTLLDLRHGRSLVPAVVGARPGFYDPHVSLYVPASSSIARLRARLAQAATGTLINMVVIGDSKVAGYLAGFASSWSQQLRTILASRGIPSAGTGLVPVCNGGATSPMWSLTTGTWTDTTSLYSTASSSGASKTFTTDVPCTTLELYYYNSSAAFSVSIDGGSAQTVTPTGAFTVGKSTFSGLAAATHTLTITTTSASSVYIIGACGRNSSGLLIHTLGVVGATSSGWTSSAAGAPSSVALALSPTILVAEIGGNDSGAGTAASTYQTNLTTILGLYSTAARIILTEAAPYTSWPAYMTAQYDVADALSVALVDQNDRWSAVGGGVTAAANATSLGLVNSDNLHETAAGHRDVALLVGGIAA